MSTLTRHWFGSSTPIDRLAGVNVSGTAERVIDLKNETHTVSEIHLDVTDHFYLIQNGSIRDADILIGPRVEGRRVTFRNVNLSKVKISCADELAIEINLIDCNGIEHCRIEADHINVRGGRMIEGTELIARELTIEDCWAVQAQSRLVIPVGGLVRVGAAKANPRVKLRNIEFKGDAGRLSLNHASPRACSVTGNFEQVEIRDADFEDCRITGSASIWDEFAVTHKATSKKDGIWAAEVRGELKLREVEFHTLTVDSEVIANQCEDRSSVDLQHAFVDNEWEVLRDNYSGTLLAFHLLFLMAAIAPLTTKLMLAAAAAGASTLALKSPFSTNMPTYDTIPAWEVLLFGFYGMDTWVGWLHAGLTVALLVYNMLRIYLTVGIVKLRSREEHLAMQRFRRARPAFYKYTMKSLVHRTMMKPLLFLALCSAVWKLYDAVQMQIPVIPQQ